jgi:hypothetical protein
VYKQVISNLCLSHIALLAVIMNDDDDKYENSIKIRWTCVAIIPGEKSIEDAVSTIKENTPAIMRQRVKTESDDIEHFVKVYIEVSISDLNNYHGNSNYAEMLSGIISKAGFEQTPID